MTLTDEEFIRAMPKVTVHDHIEGSFEPELVFDIAQRNGIEIPYNSPQALRAAYKFNNLQEFLDIYYQGMDVLRTEQDFYDLTMAYIEHCAEDNVLHTEIFFDPQGHTERGVDFDTALGGIVRGLDDAKTKYGISTNLIMCFLRHLPEKHDADSLKKFPNALDAETTLDQLQASPLRHRVIGLGLDSSEVGFPPMNFAHVFARGQKLGYRTTMHAGEEGPPEYIRQALELNVERIDHGNRCMEDPALVKELVEKKIMLTNCPLSNIALCVIKDMKDSPVLKQLELGLKVTVSPDDAAFFGGYANDNLLALHKALPMTRAHFVQLQRNAIDGSWAGPERKKELHQQLDDFIVLSNQPDTSIRLQAGSRRPAVS